MLRILQAFNFVKMLGVVAYSVLLVVGLVVDVQSIRVHCLHGWSERYTNRELLLQYRNIMMSHYDVIFGVSYRGGGGWDFTLFFDTRAVY